MPDELCGHESAVEPLGVPPEPYGVLRRSEGHLEPRGEGSSLASSRGVSQPGLEGSPHGSCGSTVQPAPEASPEELAPVSDAAPDGLPAGLVLSGLVTMVAWVAGMVRVMIEAGL